MGCSALVERETSNPKTLGADLFVPDPGPLRVYAKHPNLCLHIKIPCPSVVTQ